MYGRADGYYIYRSSKDKAKISKQGKRAYEMNNKLMERIRKFNRKAEKAEKDGYTVANGFVWEGWGNHAGPCARKVCKVEDYKQSR